jgi:hypothetical protein
MAATAVLYVVVPRLLLALTATLRLARASEELTPPESLLAYARRTLGASDAALPAQAARLTCFAYQPAAQAERGVQRVLHAAFGPDTRIEFAPAIAYGSEDAFAAQAMDPARDVEVLLFSLAATPEVENQHHRARRWCGRRARACWCWSTAPPAVWAISLGPIDRAAWAACARVRGVHAGSGIPAAARPQAIVDRCIAVAGVQPHERSGDDCQPGLAVAHERRQDDAGTHAAAA